MLRTIWGVSRIWNIPSPASTAISLFYKIRRYLRLVTDAYTCCYLNAIVCCMHSNVTLHIYIIGIPCVWGWRALRNRYTLYCRNELFEQVYPIYSTRREERTFIWSRASRTRKHMLWIEGLRFQIRKWWDHPSRECVCEFYIRIHI